jgi:hypothetical protein
MKARRLLFVLLPLLLFGFVWKVQQRRQQVDSVLQRHYSQDESFRLLTEYLLAEPESPNLLLRIFRFPSSAPASAVQSEVFAKGRHTKSSLWVNNKGKIEGRFVQTGRLNVREMQFLRQQLELLPPNIDALPPLRHVWVFCYRARGKPGGEWTTRLYDQGYLTGDMRKLRELSGIGLYP